MTSDADTASERADTPPDHERRALLEETESRNLLALAAFQVLLRIGWIFKTETVIMPDFLDAIAGAGWIRGLRNGHCHADHQELHHIGSKERLENHTRTLAIRMQGMEYAGEQFPKAKLLLDPPQELAPGKFRPGANDRGENNGQGNEH